MIPLSKIITSTGHSVTVLKGTPISKGIAEGRVFIKKINKKQLRSSYIRFRGVEVEGAEYLKALAALLEELEGLFSDDPSLPNPGKQMIDLSISLLKDPFFSADIPAYITFQALPAQTAILKKLSLLKIEFDKLDNEYFRSRFEDFNVLGNRLIDILNGDDSFDQFKRPAVFIAEEVSPAEIVRFSAAKKLLAVVSIKGGTTSHAAILAESYGIPAIFGVENLLSIRSGQRVVVDAYKGYVIVDPDAETLVKYRSIKKRRATYENKLIASITKKSKMASGEDLDIFANIGSREDIAAAKKAHADGIGLLRTEVFTMADKGALSEERIFKQYSGLLASTDMHAVTIRTLDLGGDKFAENVGDNSLQEANPFLGYRATRMFIDDSTPLRIQLRALLRASVKNPHIKIMFPFVTTVEDILCLRAIYGEIVDSLKKDLPHILKIPVGMMAEIPSTILCLDDFCPHVDFISLGTNDLTQYTLAVDRNNPFVAGYYQNAHPSVLKLIAMAISCCGQRSMPLSLCGEMAKEPYFTRLFLGMGLRTLSLNPSFIPLVKFIAVNSEISECHALAERALKMKTSREIINYLDEDLSRFLQLHDASFDYEGPAAKA